MARYVQKSRYLQQLKDNDEACSQAFEKGSYMLFCNDKPFLSRNEDGIHPKSKINWRSFEEVHSLNSHVKQSAIVLDVEETEEMTPLFVCSVPPNVEGDVRDKYNGFFSDMRKALFTVSDEQHQLISRGYAMITWNETVKFCSFCGAPLDRKLSGCSKVCRKRCDERKMTHYPQIHPVAITRVLNHSLDKILLVRQPRHPKGMYSCIAGFMEPGEVLQDNVRREIAEEVGIIVERVQYFQSESWPLPQTSLMLACTAVAMKGSEEIEIDKEELEDGRWFTKQEIKAALGRVRTNPDLLRDNPNEELLIPPHGAVANYLIRNWIENYHPSQL